MKKVLLVSIASLLFNIGAVGQNYTFNVDSLEYILPNFSMGSVLFTSGDRSVALLNINTFDNAVRFIDENKDTLIVKNEDEIEAVYVNNRFFSKWQRKYMELLNPAGETSVGVVRFINAIKKANTGAYGVASETTSVSSLSHMSDAGGSTYKLKNRAQYDLDYKEMYYICKGGKVYIANSKGFQRIYPKQKEQIKTFIKENDIDFDNLDSIKKLYDYCVKNQ